MYFKYKRLKSQQVVLCRSLGASFQHPSSPLPLGQEVKTSVHGLDWPSGRLVTWAQWHQWSEEAGGMQVADHAGHVSSGQQDVRAPSQLLPLRCAHRRPLPSKMPYGGPLGQRSTRSGALGCTVSTARC